MQKNVTSQKLIVFAFDSTTNLPKTGDAANITAYVSKDYGSVTVLGDTSATEMDSTNAKGYYLFDLTQAETNADTLLFSAKSSTANIVVIGVPATVFTTPPNFDLTLIDASGRIDIGAIAGSATAATAQKNAALAVVVGSITGSPTTTTFIDSTLSGDTDYLKGRVVIFTSGNCKYEQSIISAYNTSAHQLTFTALTQAPATSDTYIIV